MEMQGKRNFELGTGGFGENTKFDDDGRLKRQGTLMTASAHIITAVIGSGVLSLAWAISELGWIAGILALTMFSLITLYTSCLLANSYRSPDPVLGDRRNYTYMLAVQNNLGGIKYQMCGLAQYGNLVGITIGYTITSAFSMSAIKRSNCFHSNGHEADCHESNETYMIWFGIIQIILSQIPNFHKLSVLSIIAAIMSFTYAFIGLGLSIAKTAQGGEHPKTSFTLEVTNKQKMWSTFQAIGDIAFAYAFATVLIEIEDTLKSSPPETQVMKKASAIGVSVTTVFYMLCGIMGYLAFGNNAPGNFLTGFGFYEPYWLVDFANACIVLHLVGAYQVFAQPIYKLVEEWSSKRWPGCDFIVREYHITIPLFGTWSLNLFRSTWRTIYVLITTVAGITFPFFNNVLGLLGAASFWPLTVYFPIEMHISQSKIPCFSPTWMGLKFLSGLCLIVSLFAAAGSIQGIVQDLNNYRPFTFVS